jgi:hypothetical protein
LNTGSLMEVLVASAVPNAAAAADSAVQLNLSSYICKLCEELGTSALALGILLDRDYLQLKEILIPRIILPCQRILPILTGAVGCVSRQPNINRFDLLLQIPSAVGEKETKIRIEAKMMEKFSVPEIALAARMLVFKDCKVGVLVLSHCCQFWGQNRHNTRKRADLKKCLSAALGNSIGVVFLLKFDGTLEIVKFDERSGYLFIIQVPEASLCEP